MGIDVAIKEVLPSNDYDVSKYFEREWRLMKSVVLLCPFYYDYLLNGISENAAIRMSSYILDCPELLTQMVVYL